MCFFPLYTGIFLPFNKFLYLLTQNIYYRTENIKLCNKYWVLLFENRVLLRNIFDHLTIISNPVLKISNPVTIIIRSCLKIGYSCDCFTSSCELFRSLYWVSLIPDDVLLFPAAYWMPIYTQETPKVLQESQILSTETNKSRRKE